MGTVIPFRWTVGSFAALALLLYASSAIAQEQGEDVLTAHFSQCGTIAEDAARLACFDAALAALPRVQEAATVRSEAEIVAGFGLPSDEVAATRPSAQADPATTIVREGRDTIGLSSKVADVYTATGQQMVVLLENGQLWREAANSSRRTPPRAGWVATITRSSFGGYRMRFEGRTGYLSVTRVR